MGKIYVVATPIGNLKDITFRAVEVLNLVDIILSETPRATLKLLNHLEIKKSVFNFFQNPSDKQIQDILKWLYEDKNIALVSEAGTPGVSDPGNKLINDLLKKDDSIQIIPIPGASALISAISVSGVNTQKVCFLGFVPKTKRNKFWQEVSDFDGAVLFFESPFRIKKALMEVKNKVINKDQIIIFRELTKIYEEIIRTNFINLENDIKSLKEKGEFTILIK